jgi:hypothetical protein
MHLSFAHTSIIAALIASVWLVVQGGDRLFPLIAAVASGVEALMAFGLVNISTARVGIHLLLPALLAGAAAVCWARASTKTAITAAAVAALIGVMQVLEALAILH